MSTASPVPGFLAHLVDDAAVFPPGNAPLDRALEDHRRHRAAAYAGLVGPLVVRDVALPELVNLCAGSVEPLPVSVIVTGGAGAVEGAVRLARRSDVLGLRSIELALRDEDDLARNARRMTTVVDQLLASGDLDEDTTVYVEPPRLSGPPTYSWLAALDEIAAADLRLKFRTGGTEPDAFPTPATLAASLAAALDRELAFKCTAGLHHAIRHRDPATGFEHHGFLNVLLATRAGLDGAAGEEVAAILEQPDPGAVRSAVDVAGPDGLASARRWFTSFGCCAILEPLADLTALDLLPTLTEDPT